MIVIPKYMKSDIESLKWKQEAVEFGNPPRLRAVSRQLGLSHNDMERCVWNKTHRSYMIWYWKEVSYKWNILNRSIKHNSLWNLSFFQQVNNILITASRIPCKENFQPDFEPRREYKYAEFMLNPKRFNKAQKIQSFQSHID